jgi:transposase
MRMSADMLLAHKIALDPNAAQRRYFARASGTARFAYNWFLAEWKRQYAAGEKPSEGALLRQLHAIKRARFHPSSKTCSCCGVIKETLALAERTFRCTDCGFEAGRDVNAALNLAGMAASSAVSACGEARSGPVRKSRVKRASVKQEPKSELPLAA